MWYYTFVKYLQIPGSYKIQFECLMETNNIQMVEINTICILSKPQQRFA